MAGLLDWVDPAREWWKSRPEVIKGLLSGAYSMATDQATREAAMARLPKPFDRSVTGEQMMDNALNAGPSGLLGKIVYHGSPHKFDKFDASKIGTGEGAQAYGHGVYLADSPGVAGDYAEKLSTIDTLLNGKKIWPVDPNFEAASSIAVNGFDTALSMAKRDSAATFLTDAGRAQAARLAKEIEALKGAKIESQKTGALYKADLPDEWIPKMLDWDKPLSQQSKEVQGAIGKLQEQYRQSEGLTGPYISPDATGRQIVDELKRMATWQKSANSRYNPAQRATEELRFLGIPGIRYLDGGSRSAGQGSYNYVVFPGLEDQVKILERNGVPLSGLLGR